MRAAVVVAGLAGLLVLAACSGTLDTDKLEQQAKTAIARDVGVPVVSVACPKGVEAKEGATFTCEATAADGSKATVRVVQTDGEGNVRISAQLVNIPSIEDELAKQISGDAKVDCPDSLIVARKGESFTCDAADGDGKTGRIRVTFENDQGRFTAEVVEAKGGS